MRGSTSQLIIRRLGCPSVKIVLYGRLADSLGREIHMDVHGSCTVSSIREQLIRDHPVAGKTLLNGRSRAVVGGSLATDDHVVAGDETVEFLPPVSGG
jgi:molybdopterin converting factor small subunit